MTRTQRRARLDALIDQIKVAEEGQIQSTTKNQAEQEQVQRTIESAKHTQ